jgi:hypothetical protein
MKQIIAAKGFKQTKSILKGRKRSHATIAAIAIIVAINKQQHFLYIQR